MAEAHLLGLSDDEREDLIGGPATRPAAGSTRRHPRYWQRLTLGRLPVDVTPEMVAVAAITELGD